MAAMTRDKLYRLLILELCNQRDALETAMLQHGELADELTRNAIEHYVKAGRDVAELLAHFRRYELSEAPAQAGIL